MNTNKINNNKLYKTLYKSFFTPVNLNWLLFVHRCQLIFNGGTMC